ncbi:hypothetical protein SAMN05421823_102218 [Catalinimonas alkaloidigena]|uniref:Uncharacterized protein n=1 Tax=Catalinimonas alkaloidigena TaxID=1075417 RepID=A0A1G9A9D4_9BACT|nr:hypothetical protein [Catalinimonas alkaloidigena]SDK23873.1 hypothetical protein SAMN05421823_102218 [Catalinimonas alkaloidigena]
MEILKELHNEWLHPYYDAQYDQQHHVVVQRWFAPVAPAEIEISFLEGVDLGQLSPRHIADLRHCEEVWQVGREWIMTCLVPMAAEAGLCYLAFVRNPSVTTASTHPTFMLTPEGVQLGFFYQMQQAEAWLLHAEA